VSRVPPIAHITRILEFFLTVLFNSPVVTCVYCVEGGWEGRLTQNYVTRDRQGGESKRGDLGREEGAACVGVEKGSAGGSRQEGCLQAQARMWALLLMS
jgi:hypothetical protein